MLVLKKWADPSRLIRRGILCVFAFAKDKAADRSSELYAASRPVNLRKPKSVASPPWMSMMGCAKATVLVVDDDAEVRATTAAMLLAEGYWPVEAGGASQAIELLLKHNVDVLFTDLRMPGLSGFVLAREAKRFQPHLHVIFT